MPTRVLGESDQALVTGPRALEITRRLGDLRLRLLTTTYLEQAHYFQGEYERVVELATDNLTALPADWVHEFLESAAPVSIMDRTWLIRSLPSWAESPTRPRAQPRRSGSPPPLIMRSVSA